MHMKTLGWLSKLNDRSNDMMFLGYEKGTKVYRCFDPTTYKFHLTRDMSFDEWK